MAVRSKIIKKRLILIEKLRGFRGRMAVHSKIINKEVNIDREIKRF